MAETQSRIDAERHRIPSNGDPKIKAEDLVIGRDYKLAPYSEEFTYIGTVNAPAQGKLLAFARMGGDHEFKKDLGICYLDEATAFSHNDVINALELRVTSNMPVDGSHNSRFANLMATFLKDRVAPASRRIS